MDSGDLLRTILGSSTVVAIIAAIIAGVVKLYNNRVQGRREDKIDESEWAAEFRAAAEMHLPWDQEMRSHILTVQNLVNRLQIKLDIEPTVFPPLPPAPPLFPRRGAKPGARFTQSDDKDS
jgi:hypothetical protein